MVHESTIDTLKRLSAAYMDLTGEQLYLHSEKPERVTRYVFADVIFTSGVEALNYAEGKVEAAMHGPAAEIIAAYGSDSVGVRVRRHDAYKHSAALLFDNRVVFAMTCITQADAELWARNRFEAHKKES